MSLFSRPFLTRLKAASPFILVLVFWFLQFRPVLTEHQNLMEYRLLDPRFTGMPAEEHRFSIFNRLPSQDASMLQVHLPYQYFLASQFHQGTFPLWNPGIGCGAPVTSDPQYKPWNPFFWPFFASPSPWMFSLGIALMGLFGAIGYAVFLRRLEFSLPAVVAGGILLAFNPLTDQTIVLSNPWAAWMFPWGLVGADMWRKGSRFGLPLVLTASGIMVYAGHPMSAVLHFVIILGYLWLPGEGRSRRQKVTATAVLAAGMFLLTAVQIVPLAGNMGQYWSYKEFWNGGPYNRWISLVNPRSEIYVSMPLWGLFFIGLVKGRRVLRWFFFVCAAYGTIVMFPWIGPGITRWGMTFGGMLVARYGAEAFWFGLLGMAAMGIDCLTRPARWRERFEHGRLFAYGAGWYYGLNWISVLGASLFWPLVYKRLSRWEVAASIPIVLLAVLPRRRRWLVPCSAGLLLLVILPWKLPLPMSRYFSSVDLCAHPPAVVESIKTSPDWNPDERISAGFYHNRLMADLSTNQNLCWNLPDIRITSPLILEGFKQFSQNWNWTEIFGTYCLFPRQDKNLLQFLGVRWFVADAGHPLKGLRVTHVADPLEVQEVPDPSPWVRPIGRAVVAVNVMDGWKKTFETIRSGRWRIEVVLDSKPSIPPAGEDWTAPRVKWVKKGPNLWRWTVEGRQASMLLVLMNDHPGWRARVDGNPAKIYRAYGTFMAVAVPPGRHAVTLIFRAPWFLLGLVLSVLGWCLLAGWIALTVRRAGRSPA